MGEISGRGNCEKEKSVSGKAAKRKRGFRREVTSPKGGNLCKIGALGLDKKPRRREGTRGKEKDIGAPLPPLSGATSRQPADKGAVADLSGDRGSICEGESHAAFHL